MTSSVRRATALNEAVAGEIRAALARRRWPAVDLARKLGENEMWLSRRLRGSQPMTLGDIERICAVLDVKPADLIAAAVNSPWQTTPEYVEVSDRPRDNRPTGRPASGSPEGRANASRPRRIGNPPAVATSLRAA